MWPFGKKEPPKEEEKIKLEDQIYNPLKTYCGSFIEINGLVETKTHEILSMSEVTRQISGVKCLFTNHFLEDNSVIRVIPTTNDSIQILHLKIMWEGEFDEGIQEALKCKEFYKNNDDGTKLTYYALKAGESGFSCKNKTVESSNLSMYNYSSMEYWDFFRPPQITLNELTTDDIYLFVEINQADGYITMWEGELIEKECVTVFNK